MMLLSKVKLLVLLVLFSINISLRLKYLETFVFNKEIAAIVENVAFQETYSEHKSIQLEFFPKSLITPKISILTSVFKADHHIELFLQDITAQTYFYHCELLIGLVSPTSQFVVDTIQKYKNRFSNIIIFQYNNHEPLYIVWNELIQNHARGEYIINANIDDRHAPTCLEKYAKFLDKNQDYDLVTSSLKVSSDSQVSWKNSDTYDQWWTSSHPFSIDFQDFFMFDSYHRIVGTQNLPHSSPMWRKNFHDYYGYFDNSLSPISDWQLWIKGHSMGSKMWFINETLSVYTINTESFGRKGDVNEKVDAVVKEYERQLECRRLNILIIHERIPVTFEGGDIRIQQVIKWIHSRGHKLHLLFRIDNRGQSPETEAFYHSIGAKFYSGDMNLKKLSEILIEFEDGFDMIVMTTWFWFPDTASIPEIAIPIIRSFQKQPKIVILSDDIHHLRQNQTGEICKSDLCWLDLKRRESVIYDSGDLVLGISIEDQQTMKSLLPFDSEAILDVLPYTQDIIFDKHIPPFNKRAGGILYIGSKHKANVMTVEFIVHEIFPLIRKEIPDITLTLVGADEWIRISKGIDGIIAHGKVLDLNAFINNAKVFVNPIVVEHTGISTKTFLAASHGLPVILNPAGLSGLCYGNEDTCLEAFLLATTPHQFSKLIAEIMKSEMFWTETSNAVFRHAKDTFTRDAMDNERSKFKGLLRKLASDQCYTDIKRPKWSRIDSAWK